jgi:hypothetical protein
MGFRLNVFRRRPRPTSPTFTPTVRPTVDAEQLASVLLFITEHAEQHDQASWLYSAFANHDARHFETVTVESSLGLDYPRDEPIRVLRPEHAWNCETTACLAGWTALLAGWRPVVRAGLVYRDGRVCPVSTVATELLGLSLAQEDNLFHGGNSLERLWELADEYTNGEVSRIAARLTAERELAEAAARVADAPAESTSPIEFAPENMRDVHDELTSS